MSILPFYKINLCCMLSEVDVFDIPIDIFRMVLLYRT